MNTKNKIVKLDTLKRKISFFRKEKKKISFTNGCFDILHYGHIDYLQVDCEPPSTTYEIMTMIPWDQCSFGVITYEHDYYTDVSKSFRQKSRNFLLSKGYLLIVSDIAPNETSCYEDWYVHPKHINREIIKKMLSADASIKNAEKYMLGKL